MKTTERQTFKINKIQKQTLQILNSKYHINTSQFIRDAINEKLQRDKDTILKNYSEVTNYLNKFNEVPF